MLRHEIQSAIASMTTLMDQGFSSEFGRFNETALDYFRGLCSEVKRGTRNHAGNPIGYFIIGLSPNSRRGQSLVLRQFAYCLARGLTNRAHLICRGLADAELSAAAIKAGTFAAMPRSNSSLGSAQSRSLGSSLSGLARQGQDVAKAADALASTLAGEEAPLATELELIRLSQAMSLTQPAATTQVPESVDVTAAQAAVTKVPRIARIKPAKAAIAVKKGKAA